MAVGDAADQVAADLVALHTVSGLAAVASCPFGDQACRMPDALPGLNTCMPQAPLRMQDSIHQKIFDANLLAEMVPSPMLLLV